MNNLMKLAGRTGNSGSLSFDGTLTNKCYCNNVGLPSDFTISFFVRFLNLVADYQGIGGINSGSSTGNRMLMRPNYQLYLELAGSSNIGGQSLWSDWIIGKWYYFTFVRENNIISMYRDNILGKTATRSGTAYWGRFGYTSLLNKLNGNMSNFKLYNRAISNEERIILSQGLPISRTGLVGEWKMNEMNGTTAYDTSGQGNHGTIVGATYSTEKPF